VAFVYRAHKAFVNLDAGNSLHFDLPPTTDGPIVIKVERITVGGTDQPGDHPTGSTGGGSPRLINWDRLRDREALRVRGRIEPGPRTSVRRAPIGQPDETLLDPEISGGTADAPEITMELLHGADVVQTKTGGNIFYPGQSSSLWTLRVSRASDNSTDRRRYRIDAQYPSVLPLADRRIPMHLLQRAVDEYWNDGHKYLERLSLNKHSLFFQWDSQLSDLYGFTREGVVEITDKFDLPEINVTSWHVSLGATDPSDPTSGGRRTPHLNVRFEFECVDNDPEIDVPYSADDIDLPKTFWVNVQFRLLTVSGILMYDPEITTSLKLDEWAVILFGIPVRTYANDSIKLLESQLHNRQFAGGSSNFDLVFRSLALGDYEVVDVEYDNATDEIVLWYVGKPVERPMTTAPTAPIGINPWGDLPDLFASAQDEKWIPTQIGQPFPLRPRRQTDAGDLAKVDYIVVLMQENRSFDQVLGYLSRDGIPGLGVQSEVDGLLVGDNDRDCNEYKFNQIADPKLFRSRHSNDTSWPFALSNPCHSRDCVAAQITGGMKSFVADYAKRLKADATTENLQRIMDYHTDAELPVFAALTREFAICDKWFGSHIGGTHPNRHIFMSGDLNIDRYGLPEEENSAFPGYVASERPTLFDHLTERGVSWKLYEHGYSSLRRYRNYTFDDVRIVPFLDDLRGFEADARNGTLPDVAFIEPDYIEMPDGNDDHCPADMYNGQILVAKIVRALINGSNFTDSKWMFLVTYDEHGGFFDHVVPPDSIEFTDANGNPQSRPIPALANGVRQLGPRVPTFVSSPSIPRGQGKVNVSHTAFEHASIPATILRRFCSPNAPVMPPRVEAAADLREILTLNTARPNTDFASLLQVLDPIAASAPRHGPDGMRTPVPTRKLPQKSSDPELFAEDFHGFMAYASSLTGRSG
jgi:phospholipase C